MAEQQMGGTSPDTPAGGRSAEPSSEAALTVAPSAASRVSGRSSVALTAAAIAVYGALAAWATTVAGNHGVMLVVGVLGLDQLRFASILLVIVGLFVAVGCGGNLLVSKIRAGWRRDLVGIPLGLVFLLAMGAAAMILPLVAVFTATTSYRLFDSPDGASQVLVTDGGFGGGVIAERVSGFFYLEKGRYSRSWRSGPLTSDSSSVTWTSNTFTLGYGVGDASSEPETISIKLDR